MNRITWALVGALVAQGGQATITAKPIDWSSGSECSFSAGKTIPTCGKNARWTEVIRVTKQGEGDLVCGLIETRVGDDWFVSEARMYCVRGRAQGGKR